MRKQTRRQVDPKSIKKHSTIVKEHSRSFAVTGDRFETETGFRTKDFEGKVFETYYEHILPGSTTALFFHEKKTKVIRVVEGSGVLLFVKNPTEETPVKEQFTLVPGDVVELPAGVGYRFFTTNGVALDFVVTQEAKYDAKLTVLEAAEVVATVPTELLNRIEREEVTPVVYERSRVSKAALQQAVVAASKGRAVPEPVMAAPTVEINKRPSMGRFSEEDAG